MINVIQSPSPNFSSSRHKKIGVQIHKTLGLMPWTLQWLQNPKAYASSHFLIAKNGDIHQLVQLWNRSWSAGRIRFPSVRAKKIMLKDNKGKWIKPGHYLVQVEFECLLNETYTEAQYQSITWLIQNVLDFKINDENLLEHQDTAIYKPKLDPEREEILRRLNEHSTPYVKPDIKFIEKQLDQMVEMLLAMLEKLKIYKYHG